MWDRSRYRRVKDSQARFARNSGIAETRPLADRLEQQLPDRLWRILHGHSFSPWGGSDLLELVPLMREHLDWRYFSFTVPQFTSRRVFSEN